METGFKLNHVILYSKNWYEKSYNVWEDLKKCLSADDYSGELFSKADVVSLLLSNFQKIKDQNCTTLLAFVNGISINECWKYGYYTKDHTWVKKEDLETLPEYDYREAVVKYVLSSIQHMTKEDLGIEKLSAPDYVNCLPRPNHINDERIEHFFGKVKPL